MAGTSRLVLAASAAGAAVLLSAGSATAAVLWNQYNNAGGTGQINSQKYEPVLNSFDSQTADDFSVPAGQRWRVNGVQVDGLYYGSTPPFGPATSANVFIWFQQGGEPSGLVAYHKENIVPTAGLDTGDFRLALSPPAKLPPNRTYWISVQANQKFFDAAQWGWFGRTVQSGRPAMWRNPGDGFGLGCTSFEKRFSTCKIDPTTHDQVFRLTGVADPVD